MQEKKEELETGNISDDWKTFFSNHCTTSKTQLCIPDYLKWIKEWWVRELALSVCSEEDTTESVPKYLKNVWLHKNTYIMYKYFLHEHGHEVEGIVEPYKKLSSDQKRLYAKRWNVIFAAVTNLTKIKYSFYQKVMDEDGVENIDKDSALGEHQESKEQDELEEKHTRTSVFQKPWMRMKLKMLIKTAP